MGNLFKPDEVDIVMMNKTHTIHEETEDNADYYVDGNEMTDEEVEAAMAELEAEFIGDDELQDIYYDEDEELDPLDEDINDEIETDHELSVLGDGDGELIDLADQGYVE